jgi:hypothetical protein
MTEFWFRGWVTRLVVEVLEHDTVCLEIALRDGPLLRFDGVRDLRLGEQHEPLALGAKIYLEIRAIADCGLEGVAFRVASTEQDWNLAFDCARWSEA